MSTKPETEREELLPCPFCGEPSDLTVHVYGNGDDDAYVQCRECTTCGPDGGSRAGAITKWNHRPQQAAQVAQPLTQDMIVRAARKLCQIHAGQCQVDEEDTWKVYGDQFLTDAREALVAAHGIGKDQA